MCYSECPEGTNSSYQNKYLFINNSNINNDDINSDDINNDNINLKKLYMKSSKKNLITIQVY